MDRCKYCKNQSDKTFSVLCIKCVWNTVDTAENNFEPIPPQRSAFRKWHFLNPLTPLTTLLEARKQGWFGALNCVVLIADVNDLGKLVISPNDIKKLKEL